MVYKEFILSTGVLNDDKLIVHESGEVELVYYTYANEWLNHEHVELYHSIDDAIRDYQIYCPSRLEDEAKHNDMSLDDYIACAYDVLEVAK